MSNGRHSYVPFYPSDWIAGTARMSRLHRSVYFDLCCYIWDYARPVPLAELAIMLGDLPDWQRYVEELVAAGKLLRGDDGSITNPRALVEAEKARDLHRRKSEGGRTGAGKTNQMRGTAVGTHDGTAAGSGDGTAVETGDAEPEPEPEPDITLTGNKGGKRVKLAAKPDDVTDDVWADFQSARRQKRAPVTETALKGIAREATKAGWSLNDALRECCERGWQGFKAEWVNSNGGRNGHGNGGRRSGWLS